MPLKAQVKVKEVRRKTGLNQQEFWPRIGVTQSGGSRYESGRKLPKPVAMLVAVAYGTAKERKQVLRKLGVA